MKISEILLKKSENRRGLSSTSMKAVDALQSRIDSYTDQILDPNTTPKGRDLLKIKLMADYEKKKSLLPSIDAVAEDNPQIQYEIYDRKTGERVPNRGPYSSRAQAIRAVDRLDNAYGAYRYGYRERKPREVSKISEAVHKLPLTDEDFNAVKELMSRPIPAAVAPIYICEIIDDDELNDQLHELENSKPSTDVRPLIAEWINRVMPDQMYRFRSDDTDKASREGLISPIHGYDPKMYKGTNDPITGNAFGRI